jgi:5-methyltetrahydropteroyltriglutamate--homocysteine methyltransferase
MNRSEERVLTTHVGSLVRPRPIRQALRDQQLGRPFDPDTYQRTLAENVREVVRQQADTGIDVPSDGEFGKTHWTGYIRQRLGGIDLDTTSAHNIADSRSRSLDGERFADFYRAYEPIVRYDWDPLPDSKLGDDLSDLGQVANVFVGEVTYVGKAEVNRDVENFRVALEGAGRVDAFLPTAAPMAVTRFRQNPYYKSTEEFVFAVAAALREEYKTIVDAGFLLQVDDAFLPQMFDVMRDRPRAEIVKHCQMGIEALNYALRDIPEDRVRFHACWGSWNGPHSADTPLREIIDLILSVNAQGYAIESANARHEHEWQVWQDTKLPEGKILIPGCISHQTNVVEHPELVALRIKNFASAVGAENLIAGSDCGFCQGYNEVRVHPSVQWAKLRSLVEGAELASASLFRR